MDPSAWGQALLVPTTSLQLLLEMSLPILNIATSSNPTQNECSRKKIIPDKGKENYVLPLKIPQ